MAVSTPHHTVLAGLELPMQTTDLLAYASCSAVKDSVRVKFNIKNMNINHDTQGNPACMGMSQTETGQRYLQQAPSAGSPGSSTRPVPYLALGWPQ